MGTWNNRFSFDKEKAIEVIALFAEKAPIPDIYHLVKICYFADLLHLEKYGRPVFGDDYIKMDNGPVPSRLYDLYKNIKSGRDRFLSESFQIKGNIITALRSYDEDEFSPSDIECLEVSIERHGNKTFAQLVADSHDSAWNSAEKNRQIDYFKMLELLPNHKNLVEHLAG